MQGHVTACDTRLQVCAAALGASQNATCNSPYVTESRKCWLPWISLQQISFNWATVFHDMFRTENLKCCALACILKLRLFVSLLAFHVRGPFVHISSCTRAHAKLRCRQASGGMKSINCQCRSVPDTAGFWHSSRCSACIFWVKYTCGGHVPACMKHVTVCVKCKIEDVPGPTRAVFA